MAKKDKGEPLESGLMMAMKALDNQIARRMERSPDEREVHGVQKWDPIQIKIEEVASLLFNGLGEDEIKLDSLLVLSQASVKCLYLLVEELGEENLGQLRSNYCESSFKSILNDCERGLTSLGVGQTNLC